MKLIYDSLFTGSAKYGLRITLGDTYYLWTYDNIKWVCIAEGDADKIKELWNKLIGGIK